MILWTDFGEYFLSNVRQIWLQSFHRHEKSLSNPHLHRVAPKRVCSVGRGLFAAPNALFHNIVRCKVLVAPNTLYAAFLRVKGVS